METMKPTKAPKAEVFLVKAPMTKIPASAPKAKPKKELKSSYADLTSERANHMATTIAKIPIPKDTYWAILVWRLLSILGVIWDWISNTQEVATELIPVDKVDWEAAYKAANRIPVIPTGTW